ncbi:unnamed protein product [Meganyctiphanes norvegica]|uniref:C-type lectin domain-containing protein n=1 Tax=Meganyctiphanes norvegica TaxID=48144 RepID=A0AAV2R9G8_MEGNR
MMKLIISLLFTVTTMGQTLSVKIFPNTGCIWDAFQVLLCNTSRGMGNNGSCSSPRLPVTAIKQVFSNHFYCRERKILCSSGWVSVGSHCYFFSKTEQIQLDWYQAREHCKSIRNGDLAVFRSSDDYYQVLDFLTDNLGWGSDQNVDLVWIGAYQHEVNNSWVYVDGYDVHTDQWYWAETEKDDPAWNCGAAIHGDDFSQKKWRIVDADCHDHAYFLCKI